MITVYGADWCEDTRRSQRLLRRLHVPYHYINIDEDLDDLERAKALSHGQRRTPTIDLGMGGPALVEPDNETLSAALVEIQMLTQDEARERLGLQNVGDVERVARTTAGLALVAVAGAAPRSWRAPLRIAGLITAATGIAGWCPGYYSTGVTSLGGPGDRPAEAERREWLDRRRDATSSADRSDEQLPAAAGRSAR
jgi:glutaredoxin